MFVSKEMFTGYTPTASQVGDSAKAVDGGFKIVGEGNVIQRYKLNDKECSVTYTCAVHTPTLNVNLLSISAFDRAELATMFSNGQGVVQKADETTVIAGKNVNSMYILETIDNVPITMNSMSKPTSLEQWHHQFTHCSPLTIKKMATSNLVDRLKLSETEVTGRCQDCILGHQA
jgi:GAG-pre-integrase domain